MSHQELEQRIASRTAVVGIVGLGYVGLPLAMEFAKAGFTVVGYDVSARVTALLMRGESHIQDVPAAEVAAMVKAGKFMATTDEAQLKRCDAISIAVPTPLSKTRDPDLSYVISAAETIARNAHPGLLIVLESTTYPGTTRELMQPRLEAVGLTVGTDVFLAFSPERVDPGNPTWHTKNTPKVVGGVTPRCTEAVQAMYGEVLEKLVPVSSTDAAEMVKLLENTFRAVNIGLVNEVAIMCNKLGLNTWEVIDAAATKPFGFMKFTPGPGLGGHCIPVDPLYLSWKLRTLKYEARFIQLADDINTHMPHLVVDKTVDALNGDKKALNGSKVLVLGMAYKKDIDDVRESPALDIFELLQQKGANVSYHDPYAATVRIGEHTVHSVGLDGLEAYDAVVIVTDHSNVDYKMVAQRAKLVVDTRNALKAVRADAKAKIVSL